MGYTTDRWSGLPVSEALRCAKSAGGGPTLDPRRTHQRRTAVALARWGPGSPSRGLRLGLLVGIQRYICLDLNTGLMADIAGSRFGGQWATLRQAPGTPAAGSMDL